jgi:hypothetical protein
MYGFWTGKGVKNSYNRKFVITEFVLTEFVLTDFYFISKIQIQQKPLNVLSESIIIQLLLLNWLTSLKSIFF